MAQQASGIVREDQTLFSNLLGEVYNFQELLHVLEQESVNPNEVVGMIGGIQRDIIQLYRAAA